MRGDKIGPLPNRSSEFGQSLIGFVLLKQLTAALVVDHVTAGAKQPGAAAKNREKHQQDYGEAGKRGAAGRDASDERAEKQTAHESTEVGGIVNATGDRSEQDVVADKHDQAAQVRGNRRAGE